MLGALTPSRARSLEARVVASPRVRNMPPPDRNYDLRRAFSSHYPRLVSGHTYLGTTQQAACQRLLRLWSNCANSSIGTHLRQNAMPPDRGLIAAKLMSMIGFGLPLDRCAFAQISHLLMQQARDEGDNFREAMAVMTNQLFCLNSQKSLGNQMCRLSPDDQQAAKNDKVTAGDVRARSQTSQHE